MGAGEETTATGTQRDRKKPKTVTGLVTSDKMRKTRVVSVIRLEPHKRYGKYVRRRTTYKAHDRLEVSREGDTVRIAESRPLSKTKRWSVVEVVQKSKFSAGEDTVPAGQAQVTE